MATGTVNSLVSTLNSNLEELTRDTDGAIADCDSAPFGLSTYNQNTLNRTSSSYGSVFTWKVNNWTYQIATDTATNVFFRNQINNQAWSAWKKFAFES